jgi:hypothetical protein
MLETFPIVKRKDEQARSAYRTKRVILGIYDAMQPGTSYHTRLDPPPAHGWTPQPGESGSITCVALPFFWP